MKRTSGIAKKAKVLQALMGLVVALSACAKGGDSGGGNLFRIPWPDATGEYHLQNVPIETYDRPDMLQGRFVKIYVDPFVTEGRLESATPIGRYVRSSGGVNIAGDYVSLQAAALHAHYERLQAMTEAAGVQLKWPAKIGLQANVIDRKGSVRNNAIFDSQLDALLIVPYMDKVLPISVNGGILAHEHFHNIFQSLVLSQLGPVNDPVIGKPSLASGSSCNIVPVVKAKQAGDETAKRPESGNDRDVVQTFNSFFLRAMNEGLADFWGWVYTGDMKFIEKSIPQETNRRMDQRVQQLPGLATLKTLTTNLNGELLDEDHLIGNAYAVGTEYARLMVEVATQIAGGDASTYESRLVSAKILIGALPTIASTARSAKEAREFISPNVLFKGMLLNMPASVATEKVCETIDRATAFEAKPILVGSRCGNNELRASKRELRFLQDRGTR